MGRGLISTQTRRGPKRTGAQGPFHHHTLRKSRKRWRTKSERRNLQNTTRRAASSSEDSNKPLSIWISEIYPGNTTVTAAPTVNQSKWIWLVDLILMALLLVLWPYDFSNVENTDGITKSNLKVITEFEIFTTTC